MRVLLIYPEFPDTFWSFNHALKFIRNKAALPPLGLLTLAAMLPKEWSKRLIDVNVTKLTEGDLESIRGQRLNPLWTSSASLPSFAQESVWVFLD